MAKLENLTGQSFGRWLVIERAENSASGKARWLCRCECSTVKVVGAYSLKSGNSRSCGCLARELQAQRSGVLIECDHCGIHFKISPSRLGKTKYCSMECFEEERSKRRVTKPCERCGKIFTIAASRHQSGFGRYCSRKCQYPPRVKKNCHTCGKEYFVQPVHRDSKYCSRECRIIRVENICRHCNTIFLTRPSERQKYCSRECSADSKKKRLLLTCKGCGKEFEVLLSQSHFNYCSLRCRRKTEEALRIKKVCGICGKEFRVTPSEKHRKFCSKACASKNLASSIEHMKKIALERGGKCLSKKYVNAHVPLQWECSEGHRWKAIPDSILRGTWCPNCARQEYTIEDMRRIAKERGGKCLSPEFKKLQKKLKWRCAYGHEWQSTAEKIIIGRWCRNCSAGLGERICRAFFEQLFGVTFPKVRPRWLTSDKGGRLELDGYSEALELAFEHHGVQHFKQLKHYPKNALEGQISRDEKKIQLCNEQGVSLIIVPEIPTLLPVAEVKDFIKDECIRLGVELPSSFDETTVSLTKAYSTLPSAEALAKLKELAISRGGKCLSDTYINNSTKLMWRCSKGHTWEAVPSSIKSGTWCPTCAGKKRLNISDMKALAFLRGGDCLSEVYKNAKTKLLWQCSNGHEWHAIYDSVRRGTWCPTCAKFNFKRRHEKSPASLLKV